ncbi:hypothetical protein OEA41_009702 [Lepraria neglecta]|uniref:F5/8 type C domain-containing protein n=1 Tax=Lepraria neglecta TaxID=209136 RepID=A0AAD9Z2B2_9LECA|nr:hypothetical protein OEA41_009702 [Lepraria neglecta]
MFSLLPLVLLFPLCPASPLSPEAANAGAASINPATNGKPSSEGTTSFDGQSLAAIAPAPAAAAVMASSASISQTGWTVTVDSAQAGNPGTNAIDGSTTTFWHTEYNPVLAGLPHQIIVDMKSNYLVGSITYLPRQDGSFNGNIGEHVISLSTDGATFTTVALGTYIDDTTLKTTTFTPTTARYVKLQALSEAGNRGPWTSCAELNIYTAAGPAPPALSAGKGAWGPTIDFPLVPVSAAIEYSSGNLLVWSSYNPSTFGGSNLVQTITATYNIGARIVTSALITNTGHDMFCEGLSMNFNGQVVASGGNTDAATSYYDSPSNAWNKGATMKIPRGYQAQATTSTGNVFVIGASWSGGQGGKNGELYNPTANTWTLLGGCPVAPMLTADAQGVYRADNHGWLFGWKNAYVFQAGPSKAMNWYGTSGGGSQAAAGTRAADTDSMCGNAAMYDAVNGKILTVGGSPDYQQSDGTANAHIITLGTPPAVPTVVTIGNMAYQRAFANSVILPDGTVFITGGQITANPFSDQRSQLTPELFNPATNTFTQMAPQAIPRNYHSVGILLPDGSVGSGGGGLCGNCATNHYDMEIYRPAYFFTTTGALATRPTISSVSVASIKVGGTFTVTTGGAVTSFSIIRMSSTTHTVNTDQRRIALTPSGTTGTTYTLTIPADPGVALPGAWYIFALTGGVPSVSKTLKITLT